jgi:hypothetical protein
MDQVELAVVEAGLEEIRRSPTDRGLIEKVAPTR